MMVPHMTDLRVATEACLATGRWTMMQAQPQPLCQAQQPPDHSFCCLLHGISDVLYGITMFSAKFADMLDSTDANICVQFLLRTIVRTIDGTHSHTSQSVTVSKIQEGRQADQMCLACNTFARMKRKRNNRSAHSDVHSTDRRYTRTIHTGGNPQPLGGRLRSGGFADLEMQHCPWVS